ncbi:MAG: ATP-binding protein [Jatrophihabitantaceae bacterium]
MSVECSLPALPESVPIARRFVLETLAGLPAETLDELALMVSELATNCVVHTGTQFRLCVQRAEQEVRVEVTDGGSGEPRMRRPAATEAHGRGLRIVDQLSKQWGVIRSPARAGKTVWFTLPLAQDAV